MNPLPLRLLASAVCLVSPAWHATACATAFNGTRRLLSKQKLSELAGRRFSIHIIDLQLRLHFEVTDEGLRALPASAVQVTISGHLIDFVSLALGIDDPDTLFFQRRLCVEGDTEVGLHIKNVLDGLACDPESVLRRVLPQSWAPHAVRRLQALRETLASRVETLSLRR